MFENRIDLSQLHQQTTQIKQLLQQVIVGQDEMIDLMLTALLADGHILLEGMPGLAKTLTAKLFAKSLAVEFARIQFTPDLMPSDVLGTSVFNPKTVDFEFKSGPIFANIVLIDEINRSPAKTQSALFEAMEEKQVSIDGTTYPLPPPFMVLATQNPVDQEGTYRLPEAQLDRFLFKIVLDYPSLEEEIGILNRANTQQLANPLESMQAVLQVEQLIEFRQLTQQVHIEAALLEYIAKITNQTRNHLSLYVGASPRASLALLNASKAWAALQGRDFVIPEDIQRIAPAVLQHRLLLTPEKEMEGVSIKDLVLQITHSVEVPR
ncbi:MAG TPA: magnesium chelatase [Microscillaceae bacterium]|jgi:MoxR-like ATPase|nr:magnesium chelatase [Microscillaceae bacterium]